MRSLMVQGCSSSAGKSVLATGLARVFARRGIDVAPFKAQNMSNNARVAVGGEIGSAQFIQAIAARQTPTIDMNPVLIKTNHSGSDVIVNGRHEHEISAAAWVDRTPLVRDAVFGALDRLKEAHDLVLLEGAGSPAEINLWECDIVNMAAADAADAVVILVVDIDRGGAFAHLYGTWLLLPRPWRDRIQGFVLNKFRGDESLIGPACAAITAVTGVPFLGVVPWVEHGIPDEDNASLHGVASQGGPLQVDIVRYPTVSNADEFGLLGEVANVRWVTTPQQIVDPDLVILPGSKDVTGDLSWMHTSGVSGRIVELAGAGTRIVGVCGGLQMLGDQLTGEHEMGETVTGLGLLPIETTYRNPKEVRSVHVALNTDPAGRFAELAGIAFEGYEIREGVTRRSASRTVHTCLSDDRGFELGPVLAVYTHGMFESETILSALTGRTDIRTLSQRIDDFADVLERVLAIDTLLSLIGDDA